MARVPSTSGMRSASGTDGTRRCAASASHRLREKQGDAALQSQPTHRHGLRSVSSSMGLVGRASSLLMEKERMWVPMALKYYVFAPGAKAGH